MTREEAIETLGHVVPFATQNGEKIAEAIDMAIEALTELQKHGRLVDADSLMKYFSVYEYEEWTSAEVSELINNAVTIIESEAEE